MIYGGVYEHIWKNCAIKQSSFSSPLIILMLQRIVLFMLHSTYLCPFNKSNQFVIFSNSHLLENFSDFNFLLIYDKTFSFIARYSAWPPTKSKPSQHQIINHLHHNSHNLVARGRKTTFAMMKHLLYPFSERLDSVLNAEMC